MAAWLSGFASENDIGWSEEKILSFKFFMFGRLKHFHLT